MSSIIDIEEYNPHNYDLRQLPNFNWFQFFDNKRDNETLGFAKIPVSEFSIQCIRDGAEWLEIIQYWFDNFASKSVEWHKEILSPIYQKNFPDNYEFYLKISWLSKIFITEGFKYPLGAFWYPKDNNVENVYRNKECERGNLIIHPGGGRQIAVKIFADTNQELDCVVFGTGGKQFNFLQTFNTPKEFDNFTLENYGVITIPVFVADKGTVIPHPLFASHTVNNNLFNVSYKSLSATLKKYNITHNFQNINIPSTGAVPLNIKIDDISDNFNILKALLLLPFHDDIPLDILIKHGVSYEK